MTVTKEQVMMAHRKWLLAANKEYADRVTYPATEEKRMARIRKLKEAYERTVNAYHGKPYFAN